PDHGHRRLLRPCRERPWHHTAEKCNEITPPHASPPRVYANARVSDVARATKHNCCIAMRARCPGPLWVKTCLAACGDLLQAFESGHTAQLRFVPILLQKSSITLLQIRRYCHR